MELLREAFIASHAKRYRASRLLYGLFFGRRAPHAMLGYAYMKCLDNVVDADRDPGNARVVMKRQRDWMADVYAGHWNETELPAPDNYGYHFCHYDYLQGGGARPYFEDMFDTMDFDLDRRDRALARADLERYYVQVGEASMRFLAHFVSARLELPQSYIHVASIAYLYADSMVDMERDLRVGLINVPVEDLERYDFDLAAPEPRPKAWMEEQATMILDAFDRARAEARQIDSLAWRLLSRLYLGKKERQVVRFFQGRGVACPSGAERSMGSVASR